MSVPLEVGRRAVAWAAHLAGTRAPARLPLPPRGCRRIRTLQGHKQRVGCMAWNHHTLATGSRDRAILLRDVRSQEPFVQKLGGHRSEVRRVRASGLPHLQHQDVPLLAGIADDRPASKLSHMCGCAPAGTSPHACSTPTPPPPPGVRPAVVPRRPRAGQRRQRQPALCVAPAVGAAGAALLGAPGGGQGDCLVAAPARPAGQRRRHRRPLHTLLEHNHGGAAAVHRHRLAGEGTGGHSQQQEAPRCGGPRRDDRCDL